MERAIIAGRTLAGRSIDEQIWGDPGGVLLCVDFDGTLSPIVPRPEDARLSAGLDEVLPRLARGLGAVAVVTGRPVRTLLALSGADGWADPGDLVALGQYGMERWEARTGEFDVPPAPKAAREAVEDVRELIDRLGVEGVQLEDKGRAVALHTRNAADPAGALEAFAPELSMIATRHHLLVEPGRNVIELRAASSTKGDGLWWLIERYDPRIVVMVGDDLGDLAAFEVVEEWQAAGKVGAKVASASAEQPDVADRADLVCDGPAGVAEWLRWIADGLPEA